MIALNTGEECILQSILTRRLGNTLGYYVCSIYLIMIKVHRRNGVHSMNIIKAERKKNLEDLVKSEIRKAERPDNLRGIMI